MLRQMKPGWDVGVIGLFTKQFNNALNLHKITKIRALYGRFSTNARVYRRKQGNLGMLEMSPLTLLSGLGECQENPEEHFQKMG